MMPSMQVSEVASTVSHGGAYSHTSAAAAALGHTQADEDEEAKRVRLMEHNVRFQNAVLQTMDKQVQEAQMTMSKSDRPI